MSSDLQWGYYLSDESPHALPARLEKKVQKLSPFQKVHICTLFIPQACILVPWRYILA